MSNGAQGFYTNGLLIATTLTIGPNMLVPCDTENGGGSAPQTIAVPLNLISQAENAVDGLLAHVGGGQANALQLAHGISNVITVTSATDSVKLPPAKAGKWCMIKNSAGANSMTVFGFGTDTIDSIASATGNPQAAGKGKLYYAMSGDGAGGAGNWVSLLGA